MASDSNAQKQSVQSNSSKNTTSSPSQKPQTGSSPIGNSDVSPDVLRRIIANPRAASPENIIALQRTYGNQAVMRLLKNANSAPAQIQRITGDAGLIELAPGVKGEVGTNGSVDKNALLYPPEKLSSPTAASIHKFAAKTNTIIHDIPDTDWLWVQVPNAQQDEPTSKIDKDSKKKEGKDALQGLVAKKQANRGGLRHKEIKQPVFTKTPTAQDVEQGGLGDCYFLAALSAVARDNPARITTMLTDLNDGTVSVRFFQPKAAVDGAPKAFSPQYVTIRKSLLVKTGIFSDTRLFASKAIWPALIEKAYAAWGGHSRNALNSGFKGAYEGIAGGFMNDAWEHLTGMEGVKADVSSETNAPMTLRQENKEEFVQGKLFIYPWDSKLTKGKTAHNVQDNDTLTTIAAEYGADAAELLQAMKDRYAPFKDTAKAMYDKAQALKVTDNLKALNFRQVEVPNTWLATAMPGLSPEGCKKWSDYASKNLATIEKEHKASQLISDDKEATDKHSGVTEIQFVVDLVKKAGLKAGDQTVIVDYCKRFMEVAPKDGKIQKYSVPSLEMFNRIQAGLKSGKYVGLGTKDWGKGTGISGGENTDKVAGIAGGHAYEVVDTVPSAKKQDDNEPEKPDEPKFVIVRNPWGRFGRGYNAQLKAFEIESGQFKLEITDLRRYFNNVYYARVNEDSFNQRAAKLNM